MCLVVYVTCEVNLNCETIQYASILDLDVRHFSCLVFFIFGIQSNKKNMYVHRSEIGDWVGSRINRGVCQLWGRSQPG